MHRLLRSPKAGIKKSEGAWGVVVVSFERRRAGKKDGEALSCPKETVLILCPCPKRRGNHTTENPGEVLLVHDGWERRSGHETHGVSGVCPYRIKLVSSDDVNFAKFPLYESRKRNALPRRVAEGVVTHRWTWVGVRHLLPYPSMRSPERGSPQLTWN